MVITIYDYLLLPIYLYIFYAIVKKRSAKYLDPELKAFYMNSFYLRMLGSILYSMLVQYYYGYGDAFTFFHGGNFLTDQVSVDPANIKYFFESPEEVFNFYNREVGDVGFAGYIGTGTALFVMKISAVLSYLAFNKFLIISLFFGFFSFAGQWRLFMVFDDINKQKSRRLLAWAVLYTPSIWFWGSGLMKDSICLGGLGFIIHLLYKIIVKKKFSLFDIVALCLLVYIVISIKSYIIIILALSLATMFFFNLMNGIKNVVIKTFIVLFFLVAATSVAYVLNFADQLQQLAEESKVQVDSFQQNYEAIQNEDQRSLAGIKTEEIDASISGMILHSPVAIFTCLFRPFPWESKKIMILFTSLESMILLFSTLYLMAKLKFFGFFKAIFSSPYILFSFVLSIFFALIIGFTTYNFGTIVRYKIILLPFYYFMLVSIYMRIPKTAKITAPL